MKSIHCLTISILLSTLSLHGQGLSKDFESIHDPFEKQYEVVDTAMIEVVYVHSLFDSVLKKKDRVYGLLALGDNYSRYMNYSNYKLDSIRNARAGEKYWDNEWFNGPVRKYEAAFSSSRESVLKNLRDSVLYFDGYMMGRYYYEEPMHQMEWTLGDETKEILGYECRKATCRWRGRDWTAWYSELPYSDGPWMFGGLPGLIMELTDAIGEHKIRAKGIKRDVYPFGLSKRRSDFRTKRERYRKMMEDYIENAAAKFMESGMVISGLEKEVAKPRRLFYCPLELE